MINNIPIYKSFAALLITSIFFVACDVPDISDFAQTSTDMTRGIRSSVRDTEDVLKLSVEQKELFMSTNHQALEENLSDYQEAMKPTILALSSLDSYIESLSALAQANNKSQENARGVVDSVAGLVGAVSGFQIPGAAVNVVTGLVTLGEQFRTAKDFRKRVNIAADIVEGRYKEHTTFPIVNGIPTETTIMKKLCTHDVDAGGKIIVKGKIEMVSITLDSTIKAIRANAAFNAKEKERRERLERESADRQVFEYGCGVIDFLKFTLTDLRAVNKISLTCYQATTVKPTLRFWSTVSSSLRMTKEFRRNLRECWSSEKHCRICDKPSGESSLPWRT